MRRMRFLVCLALTGLLGSLTACFHVVAYTGALPSPDPEVFHEKWYPSYLFGLVAPETLVLPPACDAGIVKFEVQHSFLNLAVTALSVGVYSPLNIRVECPSPENLPENLTGTQTLNLDPRSRVDRESEPGAGGHRQECSETGSLDE